MEFVGTEGNLERDGTFHRYSTNCSLINGFNQGWRRNVKARLFVMTLRDYFSDISIHTSTPAATDLSKEQEIGIAQGRLGI